jgi:hypothetical protein
LVVFPPLALAPKVSRHGRPAHPPRIDPLAAQLRRWAKDGLITR